MTRNKTFQKPGCNKYRNQANFLEVVMESSPFAMHIMDAKGVIIRANQALRNTLNLTDEMINMKRKDK